MNARARTVAASGLIFMPSGSWVALAAAALVGTGLFRPLGGLDSGSGWRR